VYIKFLNGNPEDALLSEWNRATPEARRDNVTKLLDFLEDKGLPIRWQPRNRRFTDYAGAEPCLAQAVAPDWFASRGILAYKATDDIPLRASLASDLPALHWWLRHGRPLNDVKNKKLRTQWTVLDWGDEAKKLFAPLIAPALTYYDPDALRCWLAACKPIDYASALGNIEVLEFWRQTGIDLEYGPTAFDFAVLFGRARACEWWLSSGLDLRHTSNMPEFVALGFRGSASEDGMTATAFYTRLRDAGVQMKYSFKCVDILSAENNVDGLEWWRTSGLPMEYSERAMDWASARGSIDALEWWRTSGLDLKFTERSLEYAVYARSSPEVLDWWRRSGIPSPHGSKLRPALKLDNALDLAWYSGFEENTLRLLECWEALKWQWRFDINIEEFTKAWKFRWALRPFRHIPQSVLALPLQALRPITKSTRDAEEDFPVVFYEDYGGENAELRKSSGSCVFTKVFPAKVVEWLTSRGLYSLSSDREIPGAACLRGDTELLDWWFERNSGALCNNLLLVRTDFDLPNAFIGFKLAMRRVSADLGIAGPVALRPMDAASFAGRIDLLEWWKSKAASVINLHYGVESLNMASLAGHVQVLEWWRTSGLALKIDDKNVVRLAVGMKHWDVVTWWEQSGLVSTMPLLKVRFVAFLLLFFALLLLSS
jgi:hypothetical protein